MRLESNGSCVQGELKVCLCSTYNTADSQLMSLSLVGTQEQLSTEHLHMAFPCGLGFSQHCC